MGSVLLKRMTEENDFSKFEARFFSSSNAGGEGPQHGSFEGRPKLYDAYDLCALKECDILLTCQGSSYTNCVYHKLVSIGWRGYWIDAAKTLRLHETSVIALDPINYSFIKKSIDSGIKVFCGGNCTVSCMLMAVGALFTHNLVDWIFSSTYQAASGGGANHIKELLAQMGSLYGSSEKLMKDPASKILDIDRVVLEKQQQFGGEEIKYFGVPLAGSLIPWIDKDEGSGISLEEWKGFAETNKILGLYEKQSKQIPVDSTCVRVGSLRSHCQSLVIKLRKDLPLNEIEKIIESGNDWVRVVPNNKAESETQLSPVSVSGTLSIPIGRIKKLKLGREYVSAFTAGDQLLWGAAEPLRRMLNILIDENCRG